MLKFHCTTCQKGDTYGVLWELIESKDTIIGSKDEIIQLLRQEIERMKSRECAEKPRKVDVNNSYAERVKPNLETVIVQPKTGITQKANKTREEIKANIKPVELEIGISRLKVIHDGGLVVACESKQDRDKLNEEIKSKLGDKYFTKTVEKKRPKVRIVGMDEEMNSEEVKECLIKQNKYLSEAQLEVVLIKKTRRNYLVIIETDIESFNRIVEEGKVRLGWNMCRATEHIGILRCFKCFGFNHKAVNCSSDVLCKRCAKRGHKENDCAGEESVCVNCQTANEKFNLNFCVQHDVFDQKCPVYKKHVERWRERINYETI